MSDTISSLVRSCAGTKSCVRWGGRGHASLLIGSCSTLQDAPSPSTNNEPRIWSGSASVLGVWVNLSMLCFKERDLLQKAVFEMGSKVAASGLLLANHKLGKPRPDTMARTSSGEGNSGDLMGHTNPKQTTSRKHAARFPGENQEWFFFRLLSSSSNKSCDLAGCVLVNKSANLKVKPKNNNFFSFLFILLTQIYSIKCYKWVNKCVNLFLLIAVHNLGVLWSILILN